MRGKDWIFYGVHVYHISMLQFDFLGLEIYRHSSAYVWSDRVACTIHADAVPGPPAALREDKEKDIEDSEHCRGSRSKREKMSRFLVFYRSEYYGHSIVGHRTDALVLPST